MELLTAIGNFVEGLFSHAHFASMVLGMILGSGFAQLAKYPLRVYFYRKGIDPLSKLTPEIEVEFHRWTIRLIAVVVGTLGTFLTWPDGTLAYKLVWAFATGLACPTLYSATMHYFPWLGSRATADKILESQ